jgi:hypothetical protein
MSATAKNMQNLIQARKPTPQIQSIDEAERIRQVSFRTSEAAKREIEVLAARSGRTRQSLLLEGLNDLFIKYGANPIA